MTPTTITISTEDAGVIERLRYGVESRELLDLFGLKFAGVKFEAHVKAGAVQASMIAREVSVVQPDPTPPWSGDGLPPVGTICEVCMFGEWVECEVVAHFMQIAAEVAAFTTMRPQGGKSLNSKIAECFRPIKTPAQIAAEERETAIQKMMAVFPLVASEHEICAALYDAGLRMTKGDDK